MGPRQIRKIAPWAASLLAGVDEILEECTFHQPSSSPFIHPKGDITIGQHQRAHNLYLQVYE